MRFSEAETVMKEMERMSLQLLDFFSLSDFHLSDIRTTDDFFSLQFLSHLAKWHTVLDCN